jgi:hypothetical protein
MDLGLSPPRYRSIALRRVSSSIDNLPSPFYVERLS